MVTVNHNLQQNLSDCGWENKLFLAHWINGLKLLSISYNYWTVWDFKQISMWIFQWCEWILCVIVQNMRNKAGFFVKRKHVCVFRLLSNLFLSLITTDYTHSTTNVALNNSYNSQNVFVVLKFKIFKKWKLKNKHVLTSESRILSAVVVVLWP